jgi:hypothetical protein
VVCDPVKPSPPPVVPAAPRDAHEGRHPVQRVARGARYGVVGDINR